MTLFSRINIKKSKNITMFCKRSFHIVTACLFLLQEVHSFTTIRTPTAAALMKRSSTSNKLQWRPVVDVAPNSKRSLDTRLSMYNLPPGKNNNNGFGDILKGALGLVLVVGFFASPLGGFVLGIFNSFLLLALLLPAIGTVGFQAWQYFNTISGNCPSCGAPARVIKTNKEGEAVPTVCFNCGAILQANYENTAIDNVTGRNSVMDDNFAPQPGASIFDIFGQDPSTYTSSTTTSTTTIYEEDIIRGSKKSKPKKDMNIIDAEIENDEPFQ